MSPGLLVYVLLAILHPILEIVPGTSLRVFLNRDYYQSGRLDFPVKKLNGEGGSLFVLAVLLFPLFLKPGWFWYLALGLVLADVLQHVWHWGLHRNSTTAGIHLVTILILLVSLLRVLWPLELTVNHLLALLVGTIPILGNWFMNSWRYSRRGLRAATPRAS